MHEYTDKAAMSAIWWQDFSKLYITIQIVEDNIVTICLGQHFMHLRERHLLRNHVREAL